MNCEGCVFDPEGPFKWVSLGVLVFSIIGFFLGRHHRKKELEMRMRTPQKVLRDVSARDLHLDELEEEWKAGTSKRVRRLKK